MVSTRSASATPPPSAKILVKFKKPKDLKEKNGRLKTHSMRTKSAARKKKIASSEVGEASGSRKRAMDVNIDAPSKRTRQSKKVKDVRIYDFICSVFVLFFSCSIDFF